MPHADFLTLRVHAPEKLAVTSVSAHFATKRAMVNTNVGKRMARRIEFVSWLLGYIHCLVFMLLLLYNFCDCSCEFCPPDALTKIIKRKMMAS